MWRIMGIIFYGNRNWFWDEDAKRFNQALIERFLNEKGIAVWDTAMEVRRLKDNASDKFLEVIRVIDLESILREMPTIKAVVTAGEKATSIVAHIAGCEAPATGDCVECRVGDRSFTLYRMPSSSRAYPLALEKKAQIYREMFERTGIVIS